METSKIEKILPWIFVAVGVFTIVSCASQPEPTAYDPLGFFMGILHGFIVLFSFIGSIFIDIRMYAFPNSGVMYDFGYLIGLFLWLMFFSILLQL